MKVYVVTERGLTKTSSYFGVLGVYKTFDDAGICLETTRNDIIKSIDSGDFDWGNFVYDIKHNEEIPEEYNCDKGCYIYNNTGQYELIEIEEFELK